MLSTPQQLAKIAIEFYLKTGNPIQDTIEHFAKVCNYTDASKQEAIRLAAELDSKPLCEDCGRGIPDFPNKYCQCCNAYKEHQDINR